MQDSARFERPCPMNPCTVCGGRRVWPRRQRIKPLVKRMTPLVPWLLAGALLLALLELFVRRPWEKREADGVSDVDGQVRTSAKGRAA